MELPNRLTAADGLFETVAAVNMLIDWAEAQETKHNPEPEIVEIWDNLPAHSEKVYDRRKIDDIDTVVMHHVGVPGDVTAETIAKYHIRKHDWAGIGYHYYILADGTIQQTQPLGRISSHCGDRACNRVGIGVCLQGHFMKGVQPTPAQIASCRALNEHIPTLLGLETWDMSYLGHKEVVATACPGSTWELWRDEVIPPGSG